MDLSSICDMSGRSFSPQQNDLILKMLSLLAVVNVLGTRHFARTGRLTKRNEEEQSPVLEQLPPQKGHENCQLQHTYISNFC
jgi:hypothetical protein